MTVSDKQTLQILAFLLHSGPDSDARNIVRMFTDEFSDVYHMLGAYWPTRSGVLLRLIVQVMMTYSF